MKHIIALITFGVALAAFSAPALGQDRVVLKNGSVVSGKIVRITSKLVIIEIEGMGRSRIPREDILRIKPKDTPLVKPDPDHTPPQDPDQPEDPPPADPIDRNFGDLTTGQRVLLMYDGQDFGEYRYSGRRQVARVEIAGESRIKVLLDPEAGVLGYAWVPKGEVARVIDLDGDPERRILMIEGLETSSWVEGKTHDGRPFAGRLDRLAEGDVLHVSSVTDGKVSSRELPLSSVRELEAYTKSRPLRKTLMALESGEPVKLELANGSDPIRGRWLMRDGDFFQIETTDGLEAEARVVRIFQGAPITSVTTLPPKFRSAFVGLRSGEPLTVTTVTVQKEAVIRRTVTGRLVASSTEQVVLETADGREKFPLEAIRHLGRPKEDRVEALMARKETSGSRTTLSIFPGMAREEAEGLLGDEHPGINLIFENDLVVKVYLRPPMQGPFFGIELGGNIRARTRDTDLVFDTVVEPVAETSPRIVTMHSHTLKGLVVKLFVAETDEILAMEVSRR